MPGVKPVVADSGSTTSSAPVASTHRRVMSTSLSRLAATDAAVSGPGAGATWTAAAVKARIRTAVRDPGAEGDARQGKDATDERPEAKPAPLSRSSEALAFAVARRPAIDGRGCRPPSPARDRRTAPLSARAPARPGTPAMSRSRAVKNWPAIFLRHAGEHALADAADGATDRGVGVVGELGAAAGGGGEAAP